MQTDFKKPIIIFAIMLAATMVLGIARKSIEHDNQEEKLKNFRKMRNISRHIRQEFRVYGKSARQDLGLDNGRLLFDPGKKLLQGDGHIGGLGGNGDHGTAVGGHDGIDGQNVGLLLGKEGQQSGQNAGGVVEQELEGDDPAIGHVLKRLDGIPVLIERAAADIRDPGGFVDRGGFAGGKQTLGLCDL